MRAGHPLAGRSDLRLQELAQQSWILPPSGSILRDRLTALFLTAGLLKVLDHNLGLRMDAYGIVTRRGHQLSPGAELMLNCLRDQARVRAG